MPLRYGSAYTLRTIVFGEADLIVDLFTLEHGRVRAVAKGARRLKSRFGSAFEPLTRTRVVVYQREGADLGRVSSCDIEQSWFEILGTPDTIAVGSTIAELVLEFAPENDPAPKLFRLVAAVLDALAAGVSPDLCTRYFEIWVLRLSGLLPQLDVCGVCGRPLEAGRWVARDPLEFIHARSCKSVRGHRWLSPASTRLMRAILRTRPAEVEAAGVATPQAIGRLAAVNKTLIAGNLERPLRTWRFQHSVRRRRPW